MKRSRCAWVCLLVCMVYAMMPSVGRLYAEPIGGDQGTVISESAPREKKSVWGWVVGAAAVIAAGVGGYLLADDAAGDNADDAKTAAGDAEAAAEEAATSSEAAAAAAASVGEEFTYTVYITGTFAGSPRAYGSLPNFTPSVTFSATQGAFPGGIVEYNSSITGVDEGVGGSYSQVAEGVVMIQVDDGFYLGTAHVINQTTLRLSNNTILRAQGGSARAYLMPNN